MHIFIHTKHLKGESSNLARKTAKVKQNRPLVMSLHLSFITYAVSTAILLLCTVYSTFFLGLYVCFPFLLSESRFCRFSLNFASLVFRKGYWQRLHVAFNLQSFNPRFEYRLRPTASGGTQDLGHSFSQYGPPSRWVTYIYFKKPEDIFNFCINHLVHRILNEFFSSST